MSSHICVMTGHIFIQDEIGIHTKPEMVRAQISPEFSDYEIHINSNGGDVYDGYQIGNMILNLGKPSLAIVEGMCASIATYIACCADKIVMIPQGSWTIHDPTAQTGGRAEDLIAAAVQLKQIKDAIIQRYMNKVGKMGITAQQLSDAMAKETTYDSNMAKEWGFADEVREKLRAVAKIDLTKFKMETLTKQETIGLFEKLGQKLDSVADKMLKAFKPEKPKALKKAGIKKVTKVKNALELTLTDGNVLECDAEDPNNLEGATVTNQDGSPVVDGTYETVDGLEIEVTSGQITEAEQQATNAAPDTDADNPDEDYDPDKEPAPENESEDNPGEDASPYKNDEDEPMDTIDTLTAQMKELQKKIEKIKPGAQPPAAAPAAKVKAKFEGKKPTEFEAKIVELEKQLAEMKKLTVGKSTPPGAAPLGEDEEPDDDFKAFANHATSFWESRGFLKRIN